MNKIFRSPWFNRAISVLFYLLLAIFLYFYIRRINVGSLKGLEIDWILVVAASVIGVGHKYWGAFIWNTLLIDLGAKINNYSKLVNIYAKAWLGRYIPGKVTWILGKIYFAASQGISKKKLAVSATLEAGMQITIALALSLLILGFNNNLNVLSENTRLLLLILAGLLLLVLIPRVFNFFLNLIYKLFKKKTLDERVTWITVFKGAWLYGVSFFLTGISYYFLSKAIYLDLSFDTFLYIVAVFNLAGVIGILAFFTPSGLGAREGILLIFLGAVMPGEIALLLTVVARVWSIFIDFTFFGLSSVLAKKNRKINLTVD